MKVTCSNPTCAAVLRNSLGVELDLPALVYPEMLEAFGFGAQQQPGDDRPLPYCRRCLL